MHDIRQKVLDYIQEYGCFSENEMWVITDASSLKNVCGLDSITVMDMIMRLEDDYKIEISDETFDKIETVGDVVNAIYNQMTPT